VELLILKNGVDNWLSNMSNIKVLFIYYLIWGYYTSSWIWNNRR